MAFLLRRLLQYFEVEEDANAAEIATKVSPDASPAASALQYQLPSGQQAEAGKNFGNGDGPRTDDETRKDVPKHSTSQTKGGERNHLALKSPGHFVAALQRAAELWSMTRQAETDVTLLHGEIKRVYSVMNPDILQRVSSKVEPYWQDKITLLTMSIEEAADMLEGGDGLIARLERAENARRRVAALQEVLFKRIYQSSQHYIDQSRQSDSIGNLEVDTGFCMWMVEVRECNSLLDQSKQDYENVLRQHLNLCTLWDNVRSSSPQVQKDKYDGAQGVQYIKEAKDQAASELRRREITLNIEKTLQLGRQRDWVHLGVVPFLNRNGLLNTAFVSPDEAGLSPKSSVADLSPLKDRYGPGGTRKDETALHPLQQEWAWASKDHQLTVQNLEKFEVKYHEEYVDFLYAYTGQDKTLFAAKWLKFYGKSYEDLCLLGEKEKESALQLLDQATARVIAAGLELPPEPLLEDEKPVIDKGRGRRIRKHQRDVARVLFETTGAKPPEEILTRAGERK
ncbi:hypothetical protein PRZ48_002427 [Zasmidium cellare]|uniref:Uncharacterized protein n=1 Tax=Zasmidium cellare TaxID=395010 RepID=A0ABR0F733_ZASCE|nr:hypothetical protein PRZ48_002427 [Zasmidium cellare]